MLMYIKGGGGDLDDAGYLLEAINEAGPGTTPLAVMSASSHKLSPPTMVCQRPWEYCGAVLNCQSCSLVLEESREGSSLSGKVARIHIEFSAPISPEPPDVAEATNIGSLRLRIGLD